MAYPKIWITSTASMVVGVALAYGKTGRFDLYWFIVSLLGLYCIEIGKNAANDLADYWSGADLAVAPENRTPFSGGRNRVLADSHLTTTEVIVMGAIMLAAGGLIGLYISFTHEPALFWIGSLGLFLSVAYSLPPFQLAYRGLGELVVGLTFGPLIVSGAFVVQAHFLAWDVLLVSLPIGFLVANILFINQYPDYEADMVCNKRNWVVRLGKTRGLKVYITLFVLAFLSLIVLFLATGNPFWLLSFVTVPFVLRAVKTATLFHNDIPRCIPANAGTLSVYQVIGITMSFSAVITRFL
jgi:1,4-dihydroxy-2-naphthoate octaprenyltransferase